MRSAFLTIVLMITTRVAFCCFCGGPDTFVETLSDGTNHCEFYSDCGERSFVLAVKLNQVLHGMDVKIMRSCSPNISDTIRVWGDTGAICRPYTSQFEVGDTIIMNLTKIDNSSFYFRNGGATLGEKVGDYEIFACGEYFLRVKNNKVMGHISPGVEEMELKSFESQLMQDFLGEECIVLKESIVLNAQEEEIQDDISLYPNPVKTELKLESNRGIDNLMIYNSSGKVVYRQADIYEKTLLLQTQNLSSGLYFAQVSRNGEQPIVKKFYKE